ncbi:diaminobutyrate--2-oxoglutarate transaminase [Marinobacterium stanieri]|uniref:Diaminobutyrate--2-oxoglutarate transaminase n=1 Tax=Marinobacterium stanieri TaxID=49186 RepID=A0A1N6NBG8_9GAMM|nr:diaminobutyrate--2-oxoglutarate transaminase [Marinobacterium stanieri]SIP89362.1 diaminobutyrate aminotransferase apoenzyme [Marinobacterium stanieri]
MELFEKWESDIRGYSRAYPTVFASASNARQVDEQGRSYIDFFAGAGVLNFGHNNPRMKEALIRFIESDGVAHSLDMATTAKREFMQAFIDTVLKPRNMNYKMQFMGPTGTNAVEAALKLARRVTGRSQVIAFSQGFHGMTLGALACTANQYFRNASGVPLNHVNHAPFETTSGCGMGCLNTLRESLENSSSGYEPPAAFIIETIQAEGGVNIASKEWLQELQKLARDVGALLIIDDIQVGCGRTGSYFSFDDMGLDPDIVCLAKGIGGFGTPLAMNLVKPEHDAHWQPGEHTGTFRGQGFSFVAGREALRYFDDDSLMQQTRERGEMINARLQSIAEKYKAQGVEVRGKGMIQALDIMDGAKAKEIAKTCFETGLLVGPCGVGGRVIKLIPPLTTPDEDLEQGLSILEQAVDSVLGGA